MWVPVLHIDYDTLSHARIGEESKDVRARVLKARQFAQNRFKEAGDEHIIKNVVERMTTIKELAPRWVTIAADSNITVPSNNVNAGTRAVGLIRRNASTSGGSLLIRTNS